MNIVTKNEYSLVKKVYKYKQVLNILIQYLTGKFIRFKEVLHNLHDKKV